MFSDFDSFSLLRVHQVINDSFDFPRPSYFLHKNWRPPNFMFRVSRFIVLRSWKYCFPYMYSYGYYY